MADEQTAFSVVGFIMDTLEAMKDASVDEWKVKSTALLFYPRILTENDLETIAGWYEDGGEG